MKATIVIALVLAATVVGLTQAAAATTKSAGACAGYWPPLVVKGKPTATRAAKQALLGTTRRADGTTQVTYAGHPLYRFVQDTRPGQTTGQNLHDFGAGWYVLVAAGTKIENAS